MTPDFLGHACALDLVNAFENNVEHQLGLSNIVQLSMDGPSVNWKAFDQLQAKVEKDYNNRLVNIGSCGLHVVHNGFRDGMNATKWLLSNQLYALHTLFDNVPARREDHESVTKSYIYPLQYCSHRWVENVQVCDRAIQVLPFIKIYIKAVDEKRVKENLVLNRMTL